MLQTDLTACRIHSISTKETNEFWGTRSDCSVSFIHKTIVKLNNAKRTSPVLDGFDSVFVLFCFKPTPQNPKQMTSSSKSPSFNGTRLTFGSFFLRLRPAIWCSTSRSGVSTSIGMKAQKPEQLATVPTWKLKGYTKLGQNLEVIDGLLTFLWMLSSNGKQLLQGRF